MCFSRHERTGERRFFLLGSAWKTRAVLPCTVHSCGDCTYSEKLRRRENLYFPRAYGLAVELARTLLHTPSMFATQRCRFVNTTVIVGNSDFRRVTNTFPRSCAPLKRRERVMIARRVFPNRRCAVSTVHSPWHTAASRCYRGPGF